MNPIYVWDTTLRDGLQVPGVGLTGEDKIELARRIKGMGADYMEIGYPAVSDKAVSEIKAIVEAIGQREDSPILTVYAQPVREEWRKPTRVWREQSIKCFTWWSAHRRSRWSKNSR